MFSKQVCESLNKFWKIRLQIWTFLKIFETFKVNVNKHFENLNESYNFLLLSIIIAGWGLGCSPSFAIVPGFRGKASPFPSPPLVYTVQCTMNFQIFPIFNPMQINMQLIFIVFPLKEGKSCALFWHATSEIISS